MKQAGESRARRLRKLQIWPGYSMLVAICVGGLLVLSGCFAFSGRPTAEFSMTGDLRPGIQISFINTSTDPNGNDDIRICSWSFGDETYADSFDAQHEYDYPGTYEVTLTVYDSDNNVSSYSVSIVVRNNVFGIPDPALALVGKSITTGFECYPYGSCIVPAKLHGWDPDSRDWIVDYMYDYRYQGYVPENIVFWIPIPFTEDLSQNVVLVMGWHLMTQGAEQGLLYYSDPEEYVIGQTSGITGINAIWDFWGRTEKPSLQYRPYGSYDMLPPGRYVVRLQILDRLSSEKIVWDFPFRVCWGGC